MKKFRPRGKRDFDVEALGFDLFGTLVEAKAEVDPCIRNICHKLNQSSFPLSTEEFMQTYRDVASHCQRVRLKTFREVSSLALLKEALRRLGYELEEDSQPITDAIEAYFNPWALSVYEDASRAIEALGSEYRIGVISNFTYAPFLHASLRHLGLAKYFESVLVSDEVGWRKPHSTIFNKFLQVMNVEAGKALFVGDDLICDVLGAKGVGMKAAWLVRGSCQEGFNKLRVKPDLTIRSLIDLEKILM